jgi:hypothetical protein
MNVAVLLLIAELSSQQLIIMLTESSDPQFPADLRINTLVADIATIGLCCRYQEYTLMFFQSVIRFIQLIAYTNVYFVASREKA